MNSRKSSVGKLEASFFVSLVLCVTFGNVSYAQEHEGASIEEIIVTAQKREQNLQKVPISISALTSEQIENAGIQSVLDIAEMMPSIQVSTKTPGNRLLSIRGVNPGDTGASSDHSVVLFVDGLYIGRSSALLTSMYDIQRIEVLKGPQGTLSGRNVAGGAINVITRRPTDEFSGAIEATGGNYGMTEFKGRLNGALTDHLASSISAVTLQRDGYWTRVPGLKSPKTNTPQNTDAVAKTTIRGQLATYENENVDVRLTGSYSRFRQYGVSTKTYPAGTWLPGPPYNFTPNPDPWITEGYVPGYATSDLYTATAQIDWDTNLGTLTSISGLLDVHTHIGSDTVSIPEGIFRSFYGIDERAKQLSQEFRLASLPDSGKLSWLGGIYLYEMDVQRYEFWDRDILGGTSYPIYDQDHTTRSIAGFATVSYAISDTLDVTVGVRHTTDRKHMRNALTDGLNGSGTNGLAPALSLYSVDVSDDWTSTTPSLNIEFSPSDDIFMYATYSEGFKAGEFQGIAPEVVAASTSVRPEEVENVEFGVKTRWFSDRLQINASAFSMDYKDMQLALRVLTNPPDQSSALRILFNASDAEIRGAEVNVTVVPIEEVSLSLFYTHLDTELANFNPGYGSDKDLSGNEMTAPRDAFTVTGAFNKELKNGASLQLYLDYRYTGDHFQNFDNTRLIPSYGTSTARLTYRTASDWNISLWGKNLEDTLYSLSTTWVVDTGVGTNFGAPRTYGLTVGREF